MKIAVHTADLDHERIDGTRVYMYNMLKMFGEISPKDSFLLYHKDKYNPQLDPPKLPNYEFHRPQFPLSWTQTAFAAKIWCDEPDVLWMPMHNLPFVCRKNLQTVVTIHDLAFKIFPDYFPPSDLRKLNFLADYAIKHADKIIAVSQSTKNDIQKFYPDRREDSMKVINHGFDNSLFTNETHDEKEFESISKTYNLKPKTYLLYVGAIQPRKNLSVLIKAFEKIKNKHPQLKLVLAGQKAWMWEGVIRRIDDSPYKNDIIVTGTINFRERNALYGNALIFVFPSLYEGFGIPVLEALASGLPTICARNSSLVEVGGEAVQYFETENVQDLCEKIASITDDISLREKLVVKGFERVKEFSWDKCARETLDWIKGKY